ncbi:CASP-like protein 1E1 isoform X2 [Vigna unguiculata]|uniref:CASP-like protein 1E1 isoform X2 n=1 Tax=Vigna unguiculata TaxID=3917 RepID=UPI0010166D9F|nr:CASP-like protein 1E1 isoform X2 [Vigna unguiculata]
MNETLIPLLSVTLPTSLFPHYLKSYIFPLANTSPQGFIFVTRMEGQRKGSLNVMEGSEGNAKGWCGSVVRTCDLFLRLFAILLTLVASVVIGADKQTAIVPIKFVESMPPLYFVGANAMACAYAALSLLLRLGNRRKGMETVITVFDTLMVALLFSSNGAAIAVGLLGLQGNSHVHWNKVCNIFGKFCDQVAASLFISLLGSITFLLLLLLPQLFRLKQTT